MILAGFLAGIIFENFVQNNFKTLVVKARLPANKLIFKSLHGIPKVWFIVAGFYAAIVSLQVNNVIPEKVADIVQQIITAIFLYSVTIVLARLAAGFVILLSLKTEGVSASLLSNLARITVLFPEY